MRYFRMNSGDEDPERLLSDEGQWTEPWGEREQDRACDKCGGDGRTEFECWSCLLAGRDEGCTACVFPRLEGLYHYMLEREVDLGDCRVVELRGERSDDVDFDADEGALLVIPTEIVACDQVDDEMIERVRERAAAIR